jgi:tetratricopeptide (TPR) repeat protein
MASSQGNAGSGNGAAFFERADEVAETGNWEFAIQLYLEGIQREPENIPRGHHKLREVSLRRKLAGGKPAGMMEQLKRRGGKDKIANLLNAEYLLAKDPGSVALMGQVVKAAQAMELDEVALWFSLFMLETQRKAAKPNKRVLMLLVATYTAVEEYGLALEACRLAKQVSGDDPAIDQMQAELSAKFTIKRGKYDQDGDFTKSVKDIDKQKELIQKDSLYQESSFLEQQIAKARADHLAAPTEPGKINALVDALLKIEDDAHENQAVEVLTRAHQETGAYQFKMRIGDSRIRQMERQRRQLQAAGESAEADQLAQRQLAFELEEYAERCVNYPTDLTLKFELAVRQFKTGKYDDAIGSFQQARREPRRQLQAMTYLGQAFAKKGWLPEAAQTLEQALEHELTENQAVALRYALGDVLEQMGQLPRALEQFSKVAQADFTYKDVRNRVEAIRKKLAEGQTGQK